MRDERVTMDRNAVEAMQANLDRNETVIFASYGLIGAILLLGGIGFAADHYLGTQHSFLIAGLIVGLCLGFYQLVRSVRQ
jgi:F0F1-type ATP synthase assembly protein I